MAYFIQPDPINNLNFLRWHQPFGGPIDGQTFAESGECLQVYQPDTRPATSCSILPGNEDDVYAIPFRYFDEISFVINQPFDLGTITDVSLFIFQNNAFTQITPFVPNYIEVGANKYLAGSFNVPCLPEGRYNLALALQTEVIPDSPPIYGKDILLVSNPVRVMNHQSGQHPTLYVTYRHNLAQFGYPYAADPTFINKFRVDALLTAGRPVESIALYEDRNRQTRFIGRGKLDRQYDFKTDYLDHLTHEAMAAMLLHNSVTMEGRNMQKLESYETETEGDTFNLYQGTAKVKDLNFTTLSNTCQ